MMSSNLEELLARENPVQNLEDVRLSGDDVEARCAAILEGRRAMPTTMPVRERPSDTRPLMIRFRPALAFAGGLIVVLVAIGSVALLMRESDVELAEQPISTTQALPITTAPPPVATAPPTLVGTIIAPAYSQMPSFSGVVHYSEHDSASGDPGYQATVEVRYAGPLKYEVTVIEESGERLALMGPGTVFFGDGTNHWIGEVNDTAPWINGYEAFRHLFFNADPTYPSWSEICSEVQGELRSEVVAGRTTTHASCSSMLEDYELWIDEESGLVLKMAGPLELGDFTPYLSRDGGWEFSEITYESVVTPSAPLIPTYDQSFPPYHLVVTEANDVFSRTLEIWYLDDATIRETYIDASEPEMIGTFTLIADGYRSDCLTDEQMCHSYQVDADDSWGTVMSTPQLPIVLAEEHCNEVAESIILGRSARHFTCDGISFMFDGAWRAGSSPDAGMSEYWYDTETDLVVQQIHPKPEWRRETSLLDVNPVFPEEIFDYVPIEFVGEDGLAAGDTAPRWGGPLIDGGYFEMALHLSGFPDESHVVLFNWFPSCGDTCLEYLSAFQDVANAHSANDALFFMTVSEDSESETSRVTDRLGLTIPTAHCGWDPDQVCFPDSPWTLWRNGIPSVTIVDPGGKVVGVFTQPPIDDDLRSLLESITDGS
jgi:peroxiredoxin